jgi:hypothetical protein
MNYGTLNGTTEALSELKAAIDEIKNVCNNELLDKTSDKWPDVQDYLQAIITKLDTAVGEYGATYGSPMESIANKY